MPHTNTAGVDGYNYRLPHFKTGSRLLFQGDSITDMNWGRKEDRNHYLGHSYVYLIAARLGVDMPDAYLDVFNRGESGDTVGGLRKRWQTDAIDMKPDLLSILIGTNDVGRTLIDEKGYEQWEEDYRYILESSRKANADLRLILLDPFRLASGQFADEQSYSERRDVIDRLCVIVKQLASDYDAVHVRTQEFFDRAAEIAGPEQWIWDGVHPLPQGHELIARAWLEAVSGRWNRI